jgi:hypothetical protein
MLPVRRFALLSLVAAGTSAVAQPKPALAPLVGATEVIKLTTPAGFIDDAVGGDGDRFAYVVADTASKAELHVVTLSTKQEVTVDLAAITLHPVSVQLVGQRAFVVGVTDDGRQVGALVELKTKPGVAVFKIAPATHITVITRDGKQRIAVHRVTVAKTSTRHEVELLSLDNGSRVGAMRSIELEGNQSKALDFRVNHWSDGYTRAYGIKAGEWDKKEDQRAPDGEATYDFVLGKLVDKKKIDDLFEQRRRFQALADADGRIDFLRLDWDSKVHNIQAWRAGKPRVLELDQPLASYDQKSVQGFVGADGAVWLALRVDPVNPDAVARKKADPEYLDIFRAAPDGKAIRKARILAAGMRHRFGIAGDKFWLIERNQSMERGGKSLTLYQLQ